MTVRDAAVKSERTQLPLRGAVRGLWTLAGKTPASSGKRGIWGDFGPTEAKRKSCPPVHLSTLQQKTFPVM